MQFHSWIYWSKAILPAQSSLCPKPWPAHQEPTNDNHTRPPSWRRWQDQPGEVPCPRQPPSTCPPRPKTSPTAVRAPCKIIISLLNSLLPVMGSTNWMNNYLPLRRLDNTLENHFSKLHFSSLTCRLSIYFCMPPDCHPHDPDCNSVVRCPVILLYV